MAGKRVRYIFDLNTAIEEARLLLENNKGYAAYVLSPTQLVRGHASYLILGVYADNENLHQNLMIYYPTDIANEMADRIHDKIVYALRIILSSRPTAIDNIQYLSTDIIVDVLEADPMLQKLQELADNEWGENTILNDVIEKYSMR